MQRAGMAMAALLLLALALPSKAQYLRCGGELVVIGDLKFDVINKCGEPALKEKRQVEREHKVFDSKNNVFRSFSTTVEVEDWTYNFGPHRFFYVVRFVGGTVVLIKSGGYGY